MPRPTFAWWLSLEGLRRHQSFDLDQDRAIGYVRRLAEDAQSARRCLHLDKGTFGPHTPTLRNVDFGRIEPQPNLTPTRQAYLGQMPIGRLCPASAETRIDAPGKTSCLPAFRGTTVQRNTEALRHKSKLLGTPSEGPSPMRRISSPQIQKANLVRIQRHVTT